MKRKFLKWILCLAIPCAVLAAGYFLLIQYYKTNIPYGTWINDIYCTGLSYDEVAEKLLEANDYTVEIYITDIDGKEYYLKPSEELYEISYREDLENIVASYGAAGLFTEKHITQIPSVTINKELWDSYIRDQNFIRNAKAAPEKDRVTIKEEDTGFVLTDLCTDNLDIEKASGVILKAVEALEKTLSLTETECYVDLPYTEEEKAVIAEYEALLLFCNHIKMELTIEGKPVYMVDASVIKNWILRDKDGAYEVGKGGMYQLDKNKVKEYAEQISYEVTTYWGKPWQFVTHDGESVEVKAGNFGRTLYTNKLYDALVKAYEEASNKPYELEFKFYPASAKEVEYGGGYGDSYVEVDIEGQHVYVYIDGELALDSPCVTGDVRRKRLTPTGVFYVEYKQRNRTLVGEDYRTPVSYWMHFYNHCGFHDANWRRKFGEEIYLNDGSHGCVNMPPAKAKEMYGLVYKGMPVIVY